ncbi:sulfate/molybdate ABC transporter ATP-binding protein [Aromatoleum evansii]|uniref:sulfate/molybdate ABC transporter ATP-binding protein n=1 Tax=Aromatoleum evansii TaxID=59406 RepID=UPI00145CBAC0|nr:sulfate ABC transporter ATP-binding protein [Aromatoleum evansii]NMG27715.1 sulfate ABC transporter ATP-binding protein [Aromatoleum evansii]
MSIEIRNISKRFGNFVALDDLSLDIPTGELVALLGPSGCGKTTLLRIIAGMETPDAGSVLFGGQEATHVHARERQVGFVFQHYALFRHMSVFENVAFGLRVRPRKERPSEAEIRERVMGLLKLVQLDWLAQRYPSQLSGGQRQRIALARALAVEPKVLLLDEPFGALDTKVRKELRRWLRRLHDEMHISSVFVTHDQEEALEVADRVVVMNRGHIEQIGSPDEVYSSPASPFVYQFLGNVNVFHSRLHGSWAEVEREGEAPTAGSIAFVRPHDIELDVAPLAGGMTAGVRHVHRIGPLVRVELEHDGETIEVELTRERAASLELPVGKTVWIKPRQAKVFAAEATAPAGKQPFLF